MRSMTCPRRRSTTPRTSERRDPVFAAFCAAGLWPGLGKTLVAALEDAGIEGPADVSAANLALLPKVGPTRAGKVALVVHRGRAGVRGGRDPGARRCRSPVGRTGRRCARPARAAVAARRSVAPARADRGDAGRRRPGGAGGHPRRAARRQPAIARAGRVRAGSAGPRRAHRSARTTSSLTGCASSTPARPTTRSPRRSRRHR